MTFSNKPTRLRRLGDPVDRTGWPPGPWDHEPDIKEWLYLKKGMAPIKCVAFRNWMGVWCGYVALPKGHAWEGKGYDNISASVHGGLTFSGTRRGDQGDDQWIGFDCGHTWDITPKFLAMNIPVMDDLGATYKDLDFVTKEVDSLARQVIKHRKP